MRISDWSSDLCSSDLLSNKAGPRHTFAPSAMCLTQAVRCEPASAFTGEGLRSSGSWGINAGRREQRWQMAEQPMIARQLPDRGEIFLAHLAHFVPSDRKSTRLNSSH